MRVQVPPGVRRANGPGRPASLLTSARYGVAFESPALLSWKVDREVKCPAGNGWPGSPRTRSIRVPSAAESEPARVAGAAPKAAGRREAVGFECSALCPWMVSLPGGRRPFEAGWDALRRLGLDSSAICWPRPSWSTGPA